MILELPGIPYTVYLSIAFSIILTWGVGVGVSRVTDKFQVTIPKDVREALGIKPGEEVIVETGPGGRIVVKRFPTTKDPLKILVGKKPYPRHIPIRELEEKLETR